jgi:hypothetical protein
MLIINATTNDLCRPAVNESTYSAAGKDKEVINIIAFFNPQVNTTKPMAPIDVDEKDIY